MEKLKEWKGMEKKLKGMEGKLKKGVTEVAGVQEWQGRSGRSGRSTGVADNSEQQQSNV